jgi:hypothetical protein
LRSLTPVLSLCCPCAWPVTFPQHLASPTLSCEPAHYTVPIAPAEAFTLIPLLNPHHHALAARRRPRSLATHAPFHPHINRLFSSSPAPRARQLASKFALSAHHPALFQSTPYNPPHAFLRFRHTPEAFCLPTLVLAFCTGTCTCTCASVAAWSVRLLRKLAATPRRLRRTQWSK